MSIIAALGLSSIDRETCLTAIAVMEQYGERATQFAAKESMRRERREDVQGSDHWDRVIVAIVELERTWLRKGECCH